MTTQATDIVRYAEKEYLLCGINGSDPFDPGTVGLNPAMPSTACYRGWMASYSVSDRLVLADLHVFHDAGLPAKNRKPNGPVIAGVSPEASDSWVGFNCFYRDLNISLPFTGGLVVGRGLIRGLLVNMGYHPFWKFEEVHELTFRAGELLAAVDRSDVGVTIRERHLVNGVMKRPDLSDDAAVRDWIARAFSLSYSL